MGEEDGSSRIGRRTTLLGGLAGAVGTLASAVTGVAAASSDESNGEGRGSSGEQGRESRRTARLREAARRRRASIRHNLRTGPPTDQPTNDDDTRFGREVNYFASYSKGLPHDEFGEVDPDAYESLRSALETPGGGDFDAVPQAGVRPLTNPEAAVSFNTLGLDPNDVYGRPAPSFDTAETAAELVELYWMALLRDVPFHQYDRERVQTARDELAGVDAYTGPTGDPQRDLFRGSVPGARRGPYVSQFLLKTVERGVIERAQRFRPLEPTDYVLDYETWLAVQNGEVPDGGINRSTPDRPSLADAGIRKAERRYPITGRDLATYVGENVSQQPYVNAALILQNAEPDDGSPENLALDTATFAAEGPGSVPLDPNLPVDPNVPDGFVDFVRSGYQSLLGGILQLHAHAAWYHKWRVNRRPRPEEFGGRVYHVRNDTTVHGQPARDRYPIHDALLDSTALAETERPTDDGGLDTSLLPQAYPDGSPTHPSYPGGHAVTAGSNATVLKAYFDERAVITNPVRPDPADPTQLTRVPSAELAQPLTVGGEIDKLATNVALARSWAGIHYRSDTATGLRVGERIAVSVLRDRLQQRPAEAYGAPGQFQFTTFDGDRVTVSADGVSPRDAFDPPIYGP